MDTRHSITDSPRHLAFIATALSFIVLASTASGIPIVWDEGEYLWRADQVIAWFRLLRDFGSPQGGLHALSQPVIDKYWMFITWSEGHPAWAIVPIAAAKALLSAIVPTLTAARLIRDTRLPLAWPDQRTALGFA